jgi:CheY-like chemotaxis protein
MPTGGRLSIATAVIELTTRFPGTDPDLPAGRYVVLSVADTGTGMDAAVRSRIFEPFFTTKAKGKGTGLGLATVYGIVKQSGGDILVDTDLGKGTKFSIYLPLVERVSKTSKRDSRTRAVGGGTETILLVEDETDVRRLAAEMLLGLGYQVLEASDGTDALRVWEAKRDSIDLLVTDVIMPQMGGHELAQELLAREPKLKVLYVSGYTNDVLARHGVVQPEIELLHKPFSRGVLGAKVRKLLDGPPSRPGRAGE